MHRLLTTPQCANPQPPTRDINWSDWKRNYLVSVPSNETPPQSNLAPFEKRVDDSRLRHVTPEMALNWIVTPCWYTGHDYMALESGRRSIELTNS